jgi:hypothetical protein
MRSAVAARFLTLRCFDRQNLPTAYPLVHVRFCERLCQEDALRPVGLLAFLAVMTGL